MTAKTKRPPKIEDALLQARALVDSDQYHDTRHATDRKNERGIRLFEVLEVIRRGHHEKSKDEFKPEHGSWNYAIRGKTIDGRELRIAVAFVEEGSSLVIVTAINLHAKENTR